MDVKVILKNNLQQKQVNIFLVGIQCLQDGRLMVKKISMIYTEVKITWKNYLVPEPNFLSNRNEKNTDTYE